VSGATLVRPALDRLRDLVAQVPVEIVLVYAPDRLARRPTSSGMLHRRRPSPTCTPSHGGG
jgi:DNA invertase Pin-like site-specific DNA recombinase